MIFCQIDSPLAPTDPYVEVNLDLKTDQTSYGMFIAYV